MSDTSNSPQEVELHRIFDEATEGLNFNGIGTEEQRLNTLRTALFNAKANSLIKQGVDVEIVPDFAETFKSLDELQKQDAESATFVIDQLTTAGSTTGLISPTNAGGSTLLGHLVGCYLTGAPAFGVFPITPAEYRVLWINPEEGESTPAIRLARGGITGASTDPERFRQQHTRDAKIYFNRPSHIEAYIEFLDGEGWSHDPERPIVVCIDGVQPTLSGDLWGGDLEQWKEGVGLLRQALKPVAVYARAQVTTPAARGSQKNTRRIQGEDVAGGQFMQWPDTRLIVNRVKGENRLLQVRGRLVPEQEFEYSWDPDSYEIRAISVDQKMVITMRVALFFGGDQWRDLPRPDSKRGVAEYLHKQDSALDDVQGTDHTPSLATYRRIVDSWRYSETRDAWELTR